MKELFKITLLGIKYIDMPLTFIVTIIHGLLLFFIFDQINILFRLIGLFIKIKAMYLSQLIYRR
jgi:lipid-A-disaccharide synthase-like uncharacterized protein